MKAKQIISLIVGITSVALSPIAWAAGHGGGGGFAGGGGHVGGGGFHGGGFSGVGHAAGGVGTRGGGVGFGSPRFGGVRAPYTYRPIHFAGRSVGGPTSAFQYYSGGSGASAARTYQFSGRGNQSM